METIHSLGIDFIIRMCKGDKKKALIYARITVNGERKEISINEKIDTAGWNNRSETVKGKGIELKKINDHIENVRYRIKEKYRLLEDKAELITAETVRNAYLGVHALQRGHKLMELLDYYQKIWEPKLKNGGFKNYRTTIKYIQLFAKSKYPSGDVYLSQVNGEFATNLEHYIRTCPIKEHDPCKGNGVGKNIQRFKRILNWATDDLKWIRDNPCSKYSCPLKKSKRKKLTIEELFALEGKSFADPTLRYVQEIFIYSCYSGLAYADVMALAETDFEWDTNTVWCKKYRAKSDELCAIPLLNTASKTLRKYVEDARAKRRSTIFPRISNKHVNECLKIIQAACEVLTPLTFHVARHTFAKTVALKNGIPLETVQMMMGHTKITTTQIYADVDEEKIINDMAGIEDKIRKKRQAVSDKLLQNNQLAI